MLNEFAEFKSKGKKIAIHFGPNFSVSGDILIITPEYVVIGSDGKHIVVAIKQILFFHEA
jgi:hypothetical protein